MNTRLNNLLTATFKVITLTLPILIPFAFWNLTTEFYETPKFLFLAAVTLLLLILWAGRFVVEGKVSITRTPFDLPFALMLAVFILSMIFSASRPVAFIGNLPRINGGLATFVFYILLYFVLVSGLKQRLGMARLLQKLLLAGSIVLALISLVAYFDKNLLMLSWITTSSFTPTGSNFSTSAILTLLMPYLLMSLFGIKKSAGTAGSADAVSERKNFLPGVRLNEAVSKIVMSFLLALFVATIVLTGTLATYIAAVVAVIISLVAAPVVSLKKNLLYLLLPLAVAIMVVVASVMPLGGKYNLVYSGAQNFPKEVQLPLIASWKVSISAFRDSPFWGTGPGTFLPDFTVYKPADFNNYEFWTLRFDQAFNEYLQFLATLGALGLLALLLLTVVAVSVSLKSLAAPKDNVDASLAISVIVFFVILALHASTLVFWVVGIILLVSLMLVHKDLTEQIHLRISAIRSSDNQLHFDALPVVLFIIALLVVSGFSYALGRFALADYHHRAALNKVAQNKALDAYNELVTAEQLNPYIDLYRTDLAQTNFALAEALASSRISTNDGQLNSLSDQDKANIQKFLSQAINEGKAATAINPGNPGNWEVLGSIYSQISGVAQNAIAFSLDSYGQAIQRDPFNPLLRLTIGGVYYSIKDYDTAIRFFTDAINLKPDFANGYYNLALALRDKGDLKTAVAVAEKAVSLIDPKSPDYKLAADLLSNLKSQADKAESTSKPQTSQLTSTSSAQPNSKLQEKSLPKVMELPKPTSVVVSPTPSL